MVRPAPVALTISGSDPSGGAGLQADLKAFAAHGVFGTSAVSLLTVQNTVGVERVELLEPDLVVQQARAVEDDLAPDAIKTGSLGSAGVIDALAAWLGPVLERRPRPLVVDPVLVSKHGHELADDAAARAFAGRLLPLATVATPNLFEARRLLGEPEVSSGRAASGLRELGARWVLVTGGGGDEAVVRDVLAGPSGTRVFERPRIATRATHGTGCATSAAIAARLALGETVEDAVAGGVAWVAAAIAGAPDLGQGLGPIGFDAPVEPATGRD